MLRQAFARAADGDAQLGLPFTGSHFVAREAVRAVLVRGAAGGADVGVVDLHALPVRALGVLLAGEAELARVGHAYEDGVSAEACNPLALPARGAFVHALRGADEAVRALDTVSACAVTVGLAWATVAEGGVVALERRSVYGPEVENELIVVGIPGIADKVLAAGIRDVGRRGNVRRRST